MFHVPRCIMWAPDTPFERCLITWLVIDSKKVYQCCIMGLMIYCMRASHRSDLGASELRNS